jgi:aryl-alcohol dehydrogenase-like predicted oxidoreductase
MQNRYNLLDRTIEKSFFNISNDKSFGLLTYSPLAFGTLSGKYINNKKPENSRLKLYGNYFPRYSGNFSKLAIEEYYNIAKKFNISLSKLSIAFVLNQSSVTSCIIGSTNIQQLEENIDSVNIKIDNEILKKINFVHKNNPNPSTQIEIKPIYKRIFIYQKEGLKLIFNNDWKTLLYKISKIIIKPLKKMLKR